MFGYCIWLEIPSLYNYVINYAIKHQGEFYYPHMSIETKIQTKDEALSKFNKGFFFLPFLTLGKPYITSESNFHVIQCDIIEYPDKHISIAYRYDKKWTQEELEDCKPPKRVKAGKISIWYCNNKVFQWYKIK